MLPTSKSSPTGSESIHRRFSQTLYTHTHTHRHTQWMCVSFEKQLVADKMGVDTHTHAHMQMAHRHIYTHPCKHAHTRSHTRAQTHAQKAVPCALHAPSINICIDDLHTRTIHTFISPKKTKNNLCIHTKETNTTHRHTHSLSLCHSLNHSLTQPPPAPTKVTPDCHPSCGSAC